jgi:ubiquinone/menaquinone biosynthesis C-methylase UbiE
MILGKTTFPEWAENRLANPLTKQKADVSEFRLVNSSIDARIFLRNTEGFKLWLEGQLAYENWEKSGSDSHIKKVKSRKQTTNSYLTEIAYDSPVYEKFRISGTVLDVGGSCGTLRHFLPPETKYISIDPNPEPMAGVTSEKATAYNCLVSDLPFIAAMAEFLPFLDNSFDYVHMRSMLDHVQIPDLAILEAFRVLKPAGSLLVGISIEHSGFQLQNFQASMKELVRHVLGIVGIKKWKDHHLWHPTYSNLTKLITDNGFVISETFWQPIYVDKVVYVQAIRSR